MKARCIKVSGKVQGVYFRQGTREKAMELGISGFVRNEPDGSVYIEAEGDEKNMELFEAWCAQGPMMARVDALLAKDMSPAGFVSFEIRR